ncbi:MAG: TerB family tellurite resistance protein [Alphaproteobacteria bacterium]|jgi:tellurite resistance protein|nr:TerB family tellurite resistance protein [Alphaproteobacteria bacterium]
MKKLLVALTLTLAFALGPAGPAEAARGGGIWGDDLVFVAETEVPTAAGGTFALCHLVDTITVAFIPVYTAVKSYAMSEDGCEGTSYRPLTPEMFERGQSLGAFPADLPVTPRLSPRDLLIGHAGPVLLALAGLFKLLSWAIHDRKPRRRKAKVSDALAINALAAMAHVAISDGDVDDREVTHIAGILTRLTGRGYDRGQVRDMIYQVQNHIGDIDALGEGLSDAERRIVMESALHIAVADGQIHPKEYQLVSQIANRLRIDGAEFRAALGRISANLQKTPAA